MEMKQPVTITASRRNGTIYIVEYAASDTARETALEKVKKLIMNDVGALAKTKVS